HAATEQGDASPGGGLLTHQALLYGSEEEFLATTVPFIRDGLERDEAIQIATTDRNTGWLRAALGDDAGRVTLGASSRCYRHPVRALAAMYRTAHRARPNGRRLRIIGEPWWTARTASQAKEWIRYESLVNSALADADVTLMCTYDTNAIDQDVLVQVARTHPELVENG